MTPDGERLLAYARAMLAHNRDALAAQAPFHGRVRVGLSGDFAQVRILRALQAFGADRPGLQVEVQVGVPGALLSKMKEGNIELVLGSQCEGEEMGRLLWREPLVWAWAAQTGVALPDPLLLAVLPEPCPYRQVALERLAKAGISQRTVLICTSNASVKAAAISGFAVAPMIASQLRNGLVRVPKSYGLPELPEAEFRLFAASNGPRRTGRGDHERRSSKARWRGVILNLH
ncbi:LysR substrate-binding domain-containing protein [Mesorhizobium sp. M0520]|uniref:LysR substrate-binding domain-containing protein n=1 Tax=Mesorhizobium sp. M0520 TaxID=2956957 RepID=UPI00333757F6